MNPAARQLLQWGRVFRKECAFPASARDPAALHEGWRDLAAAPSSAATGWPGPEDRWAAATSSGGRSWRRCRWRSYRGVIRLPSSLRSARPILVYPTGWIWPSTGSLTRRWTRPSRRCICRGTLTWKDLQSSNNFRIFKGFCEIFKGYLGIFTGFLKILRYHNAFPRSFKDFQRFYGKFKGFLKDF